jgi:mRNA interferase MazF
MVKGTAPVPERGDLVWIDLDPHAGHEQAGRRPALILSPREYNAASRGLALICPISTKAKGYPFEVAVPPNSGAKGVIIADQVKSVDWVARGAVRMGRVQATTLQEVTDLIAILLGL